jgi:hypothetical protein
MPSIEHTVKKMLDLPPGQNAPNEQQNPNGEKRNPEHQIIPTKSERKYPEDNPPCHWKAKQQHDTN